MSEQNGWLFHCAQKAVHFSQTTDQFRVIIVQITESCPPFLLLTTNEEMKIINLWLCLHMLPMRYSLRTMPTYNFAVYLVSAFSYTAPLRRNA